MDLKQKRLDLMDNLLKLRTSDDAESDTIKETCNTLMQEIKKANDEIRIAKIKKEVKDEISDVCKKEGIGARKVAADDILFFKRMLDNLKPAEQSINHKVVEFPIAKKIKAKLNKKETISEYDKFLVKLCEDMKGVIVKLDEINSMKGYDFDLDFAEYFIDISSRKLEKEKYFHGDVLAMNNLYKKVYSSIEQLEKIDT